MYVTNLQQFKDYLNGYISSGKYLEECTIVTDYAKSIVNKATAKNPCACFDIDDTALMTILIAQANDWGYPYDELVLMWKALFLPPLDPVLSLYVYVLSKGYTTFFISSRSTEYQSSTEAQLKAAGYSGYKQTILKDPNDQRTTTQFKTDIRGELISQGYDIVINIGDCDNDLQGNADNQIKLPNKFYE